MEDDHSEEISKIKYYGSAAGISAIMWIWCFIEQFSSYRITKQFSPAREEALPFFVPIAVTIVAFIVAYFYFQRAEKIAQNGVIVYAQILSVGGEYNGMHNVEFVYEFDGVEYTKRKSLYGTDFSGDSITLIVDSTNPKRYFFAKE